MRRRSWLTRFPACSVAEVKSLACRWLSAAVTCSWTLAAACPASSASRRKALHFSMHSRSARPGPRSRVRACGEKWGKRSGLAGLPSPIFSYSANIVGVEVLVLLLQFRDLALDRAKPRLLLQRRRDAGAVAAQGLVDVQFLGFAAERPMPALQLLHARLRLAMRCLIASSRSTASAGSGGPRFQRGQLLAQPAAAEPSLAQRGGQVADVELPCELPLLLLQPRQLASQHVGIAGKAVSNLQVRLLVRDLPANLLPLRDELRHLARAGLRVDDVVARCFRSRVTSISETRSSPAVML